MATSIGADFGGSNSRVAVFDESGRIIDKRSVSTDRNDYRRSLNEIRKAISSLDTSKVGAAVVAVAGVVADGYLTGAGNITGWIGHNLQQDFSRMFGVSTTILNDCAAAALGEYTACPEPLVFGGIGTGVGVATVIMINGKPYPLATEAGHVKHFNRRMLKCGCGGWGHLEAHVGGRSIKQRFGAYARELDGSNLTTWINELSVGVSSWAPIFPTIRKIVLGGGPVLDVFGPSDVSKRTVVQQENFLQLVRTVGTLKSTVAPPEILIASHGDDAGLVGAGYMGQQLIAA